MLANGKPVLTEEEKEEVERKLKEFDEEEMKAREKAVNSSIERLVGIHYLKYFNEESVAEKEKIDKKISEMFSKGKGLILFGNVGVGKTMALVYIFRKICESYKNEPFYKAVPVSYYFMPELFRKLHCGEVVSLKNFVMLDDWGREYAEPFALSQFEALIEKIYASERILIITTNLTREQFINREGWARITDRVREMCGIIEINGSSRRHR